MAATDNVSAQQFMSVAELKRPLAQGGHWDPNMGTPEKLYAQEGPYIDRMAGHIREHGSIGNVALYHDTSKWNPGMIHDGHHRVIAEELAGNTQVPVRRMWHHEDEKGNVSAGTQDFI